MGTRDHAEEKVKEPRIFRVLHQPDELLRTTADDFASQYLRIAEPSKARSLSKQEPYSNCQNRENDEYREGQERKT